MRPIKLIVEGFTSFVERAEVDFSELDLFAIIGPTGSGKTSLLDAITWVLYGRTSRLNKTAADLISHSADRVSVHLEFSVGANKYQIARTARRSGSPKIRLDKYIGEWSPIETGGATETNDAICKIIGLDFDAFTRSVILPQGKFDAFLRGEHKGRREILKKLLGLEVYDRMRELATQKKDQFAAQRTVKQDVIEREYATANDETLNAHQVNLEEAKRLAEENTNHRGRAEQLLIVGKELRRNRGLIANHEQSRSSAEKLYLEACGTLTDKTEEVKRLTDRISATEDALSAIAIDDAYHRALVALNERAKNLATVEKKHKDSLKSLETERPKLLKLQKDLAAATAEETRKETARAAAEASLKEARATLNQTTAKGSPDLLKSLIEALHGLPTKRESVKELEAQKGQERASKQSISQGILDYQSELAAKQGALNQAKREQEDLTIQNSHRELKAGLKKGGACPICEQIVKSLPAVPGKGALEGVKTRVKKLELEISGLKGSIAKAESQLEGLPRRLADLDSRITVEVDAIKHTEGRIHKITGSLPDDQCLFTLNSRIAELNDAETQATALGNALEKANTAARSATTTVRSLEKQVEGLAARLGSLEQEIGKLTAEMGTLRPEIEAAGGAATIVSTLASLQNAIKERERISNLLKGLTIDLQAAQAAKSHADSNVAVFSDRMRAATEALTRLTAEIGTLGESWSKLVAGFNLPPGKDEAEQAEKKRLELEKDRLQITGDVVRLNAAIEDTQAKIARLAELKTELEEVRAQLDVYSQLSSALRADNFISYLLEAAYSDLCEKGSSHLLRLSDERYSFTAGENEFCVKDGWNGDAERSASTLSGGESFLASLSLALALGDSVASVGADGQPGTRLETLFLDEGVSTLDQDETLPGVVDALTNLQTGDRMVGVISHMENLAERMPARIVIVKKHGRSTINVQSSNSIVQVNTGYGD